MNKNIIDRLLTVKSIVTMLLTGVFCYLSATSKIESSHFMTIFTMIISFYFGTQAKKDEVKNDGNA